MSSHFLMKKSIKAGVSIEAALVIPLFIFFMSNLMMLILMFKDYSVSLSKAQQTAKSIALVSYDQSDKSEMVVIMNPVPVKALFEEIGFPATYALAGMKYRKWNGYNPCNESTDFKEEEYVYMTEYGTVYHRDRSCSHLMINIQAVTDEEIDKCRNENMEKYYPCEKCGGLGTGIVFITKEGNRYHGSASCSGLKRTVKAVKLSEVEGIPECSTCGR